MDVEESHEMRRAAVRSPDELKQLHAKERK